MSKSLKRAEIDPDQSLRRCARSILRARLKRLFVSARKAAGTQEIEALHRLRLSARRAQVFLKIFRDCFPKKKFADYTRLFRRLLRSSGQVREYDILISMLEQRKNSLSPSEGVVLDLLIARKARERREARKNLEKTLRLTNRKRFESEILDFVSDSL